MTECGAPIWECKTLFFGLHHVTRGVAVEERILVILIRNIATKGGALLFCNLQARPEREERNAEMLGTDVPTRRGGWEHRVGAKLSQLRWPVHGRTYAHQSNQWRLHPTSVGSALPSNHIQGRSAVYLSPSLRYHIERPGR